VEATGYRASPLTLCCYLHRDLVMELWTIQTEEAWRALNRNGYLRCRRSNADRDFLPAYIWMASKMVARIGCPTKSGSLPLWAWYQYDNARQRRPDLRRSGHLPRGTCGYRIGFTIPDNQVLLSDFELWHYVLNYWYLPRSERDAANFDSRYESLRCSWATPPRNQRINATIQSSWDRIFDLDWSDEYVALPKSKKSIQATFWRLDLSQVTSADYFGSSAEFVGHAAREAMLKRTEDSVC